MWLEQVQWENLRDGKEGGTDCGREYVGDGRYRTAKNYLLKENKT